MPFPTIPIQPLTAIANVTVRFAGLMLLKPDGTPNNGCEIGIHRFTSDHSFQIILIVRKPQRPPTLIRLVTGALTRPFAINASNPGTGVQTFAPSPAAFVRNNPSNNELDFRWALDMGAMHAGVDFNDGARPVATLNAGVLYTPTLTRPSLNPQLEQGSPVRITPLHRFAADLAAAINLRVDSTVDLTWDELGDERNFTLPRRFDPPGTTYTISLMNDPPTMGAASHEELSLYYKVLQVGNRPIAIGDRCRLRVSLAPPRMKFHACL